MRNCGHLPQPRKCLMCRDVKSPDAFEVLTLKGKKRLCRKRICIDCFPRHLRHKATLGWSSYIKRKYDLTPAGFEQLGKSQSWRCRICGTDKPPLPDRGRKNWWTAWHIDHDHETGKVRGLLCFNCNQLLGQSKDKITVLEKAVQYLVNHKGTIAYLGGTFDLLHPGHLKLIEWARNKFGRVIVSLNRDSFILRYKQKPPTMTYAERFEVLSELRNIEQVVENIGDEDSKPAILASRPTHIVSGSDWTRARLMKQMGLTERFLNKNGITIVIFPDSDPIHSSDIKKRMV